MKKSEFKKLIREEVGKVVAEMDSTTTGDDNLFDDLPAVDLHIDDSGNMSISIQAMYHDSSNHKVPILMSNPHLREKVVQIIRQKAQVLFRSVIHGVAGEPYGLK
jgi:hypothetical protein